MTHPTVRTVGFLARSAWREMPLLLTLPPLVAAICVVDNALVGDWGEVLLIVLLAYLHIAMALISQAALIANRSRTYWRRIATRTLPDMYTHALDNQDPAQEQR